MTPRPRVCFFNRSYAPDQTATGQLLTELAEDLRARHGWDVWVVAGMPLLPRAGEAARRGPGVVVSREERNGVSILRARGTVFSPRVFAGRAANYVSYFLSACLAGLRAPRVDAVVSLTDPPIIGLAALWTARRSRAPFVLLCQDVFPEAARALGFRDGPVVRLLARVNRFLVARADRVIALGDTMRDRLVADKGADPERVAVIHNWADCSAIVPGPKQNAFSAANGLADAFVVMHSGNLGLSQSLDTLLDAAERLRGHPDVVVALVGDGTRREALQSSARARGLDNVRFLPYQPKERLRESFASADVFVVALERGLAGYIVPSKLYGVLAAGRPYVAAVEEPSEVAAITRASGAGLLAEPGDAADLADKILAIHADRGLAERMGAAARRAALAFDRAPQVGRYDRLLREVLGEPPIAAGGGGLLKRALDVALSAAGLVASMPLWAVIAVVVKAEDGGSVFYGQERVGRGGRPFVGWKFRSMVEDADRRYGQVQARAGDPRVTRVGRVLRATAMDELPQLWSILKGDMSFVGPRALRPEEVEVRGGRPVRLADVPGYRERHRVTPGLTGLAQVYAPRDIPVRHKFRLDLLYVERRSAWLDLRLIALSVWISLRGRWERRGPKI